jgi:hypothetical protein
MKLETSAKANAQVQPVDNLIKPTVFPFNINPKDCSDDSLDELKQWANKTGKTIVVIEDDRVRYTGNFMQLYFDGMSNLRYLKTYGLSMLNYIYRNIGFGCNWIVLNQTKISEELSVSQPRISDGIRQLIAANFIVKAVNDKNNVYIINHNMMFMGDRNKFISDYMRLYSDK